MIYVNTNKDEIKRNTKLSLVKRFFLIDKQFDSINLQYIIRIPQHVSLHIRAQVNSYFLHKSIKNNF